MEDLKLLVVGSVAIDSVQTPFGFREESIGGSALYFSAAASLFSPVSILAVVGEDFPMDEVEFLSARGADLSGLKTVQGRTFRWKGQYGYDLNEAKTLETHLNVFEEFAPELTERQRSAELLFLANIDPELQLKVLDQVDSPALVAADTMNFWIEGKRKALQRVVERVDLLVLNEGEARMLTEEVNLVKAAQKIMEWGPSGVVIKRGEYGVIYFAAGYVFSAPAYPLEELFDPTGAGDSFAGGMMGALAASGDLTPEGIKRAIVYGSAVASFNVEDFSFTRLASIEYGDIKSRFGDFVRMTAFEKDI
ncbi:MAG: sugar kinase [Deltaproteobacteria bacterium]|nr:MAG: sugar kinase [Deltaproteobacteria bacterium]